MKRISETSSHIPDIEIIDLEAENAENRAPAPEPEPAVQEPEEEITETPENAEKPDILPFRERFKIPRFVNMHTIFLGVFVIFVVCLIVKFSNWGVYIDQAEIGSNNVGYLDILDSILPLVDENGMAVETAKADTIVVFGNAPFADDRDSKDNLANMIAKASDAKVYNCSVSNSYLASRWPFFDAKEKPMDAYCFYWLAALACTGANSGYYDAAAEVLGDATPPEAAEVYETLTTLDFNEVDVIAVMYDASDYLMGHEMYDDVNPTNIQYFTGNLEAGIELFQMTYPHIRIIVMSPTYAYGINENGEYVSSDIQRYGQDVLSTYVIKQNESCANRSVTFVDNLYGTITSENAEECLTDNLHLNTDGRKLLTERFLYALNYFDK